MSCFSKHCNSIHCCGSKITQRGLKFKTLSNSDDSARLTIIPKSSKGLENQPKKIKKKIKKKSKKNQNKIKKKSKIKSN